MKNFHVTGNCVPDENYMVDTSDKVNKILEMIRKGSYFTINRPRQYGKTTTLDLVEAKLAESNEYLPIMLSFEGIGETGFVTAKGFCVMFLSFLAKDSNVIENNFIHIIEEKINQPNDFYELADIIADILRQINKKVVLMIDEVDKSSNYKTFIEFLGLLRSKYLKARKKKDVTFHSVILAGVLDVKNLKYKIRGDGHLETNSPWNIAADFVVDMSFNPKEISTMLNDYKNERACKMNVKAISERLHFWTSGYPFLVSRLCKIIDENIIPNRKNMGWSVADVEEAVKYILRENNTLFESIIKNLKNNKDLYVFIQNLVLGMESYTYVLSSPTLNLATQYGLINYSKTDIVMIHNKIFEDQITNYFISNSEIVKDTILSNISPNQFVKPDGKLDFDLVLSKFQQAVKENYIKRQFDKYLEIDLRLMFMMFLKPIINGFGFCFKEAQIGEEKRLDVVVVFKDEKFVVELKMWYNEQYHEQGKGQLKKYMELENINKGYMLIFSKDRERVNTSHEEDGIMLYFV